MGFKKIRNILFFMVLFIGLSACGSDSSTGAGTSDSLTDTGTSDTTAPVITLNGNTPVTVEAGQSYSDAMATVTDNVDTTNVSLAGTGTVDTTTVGSYTITYNSTDAAGNAAAMVTRTVNVVDTTKPVITLNGNTPVIVEVGGSYSDAKATVTDNADTTNTALAGSGSVDISIIGSYTITYNAEDAAGNAANTVIRTVNVVDITAPAKPVITFPLTNVIGFPSPTFRISGTAEAGSAIKVYVTGSTQVAAATADASGDWSTTSNALSDGNYTLTATATDGSGNVSTVSASVVVTVDTTAQAPVITTPATGSVSASGTITVTGTAEAAASIKVYAGGSTPVATATADNTSGQWSATTSALSDGNYTLTVTSTDLSGNVSAVASVTVTVDSTAPAKPVITTPLPNAAIGSSTISISGTAEANTTIKVYAGGSTAVATVTASASGSWSATTSTLIDGSYTLTATATDAAGSVSPTSTSVAVTVDTVVPANPVVTRPLTTISYSTAQLNAFGTAEANATIKVYTGGSTLVATTTADGSGVWDTNTSTLSDGSYTLTVTATDAAGNVSTVTSIAAVTVDTTVPAAPVITAPATASSFSSSFILSGTAEAGSTVKIFDGGSTQVAFASTDTAGKWGVAISSLSEGSYTLTVTATDAAGNVGTASSSIVVTVDSTAPAQPVIASPISGGSLLSTASLAMSGSAEAGAKVVLYVDGTSTVPSGNTVTADSAGAWSMNATLNFDGTITLTVKAEDAAGNTSVASVGLTLTVDSTIPNKPLFITTSGNVNTATPVIQGQAEFNATVTLYNSDGTTVVGSGTAGNAAASGLWSITTTTLTLGAHTITAKATDAAGNTSVASVDLNLTVEDNTAPAQPAISSPADASTVTTATPTVSGTAEASTTITLYTGTTSRGTTTVDSSGNWTMQSSSLANGSYTLTVKATDASGNTSTASAGVSITVNVTATITGAVVDGRVSGATLTLFSDADMTTQVGSGSTDTNGDYSVALSVTTAPSPIYILSTGGTDIETGLAAPTMTFVGETAGSGSLISFNVTPLTQEIYGRVRNGATLNNAQTGATTAFGLTGSSDLYSDPSADGTGVLRAAAFKKLSAATGGATLTQGTYKMFALTMAEGAVGVETVSSIADLVNPMSTGGAFFVEADINVDANGVITGSSTGGGGSQFFTGKISGSSMVFNISDSTTSPTSVTRIVGNIGLNGSVSGSFSDVRNLDTTPILSKGIYVGSLIPSTGINMTGLEAFVSDYYTPGASTGLMNIVARDLFGTAVPRVSWGQAALTGINMSTGAVTMSDFSVVVDAGSDAAGAAQSSAFQSGLYVKTSTGIPTNILVFEYQLPGGTDKLYMATVVGLRRGIYFVVPSATGTVDIAGESYISKVNSLAPSAFTAGATHDITTANIDLGMLGQTRADVISFMGLTPEGVPGGMSVPVGIDTSNSFVDTASGAPELMVFQGSMFIMKADANNDFADNTLDGGTTGDHMRVVEFFESGAMQGEEIVGGVYPTRSTPFDGQQMRNYPSTFVGFVRNQNDPMPVYTGNLNFLSRTLYSMDYSGFANAYTSGSLSITAPTTTAGTAILVTTSAGSSTAVTSTLTVDVPAAGAPGVYHIHGAFGSSEYIDIDWPIGGTKALYAISNASDGTGNISEVGEAFLTQ